MPLSKIHVPQLLSKEICQLIAEELHTSLVNTCGVKKDDNFCLITRYSQNDMIIHPEFLGNRDPDSCVVVEIALLGGRSDEQKEALYTDFRKRLNQIGFAANNSIVYLIENSAIDWSFSDAGSVKKVLGLN
jgi:hypothetical protein